MSPATISTFKPNPFETARALLIQRLQGIQFPQPINAAMPWPEDFEAIGECIREIARAGDECLAAFGHEVQQNTWVRISTPLFNGVFLDAVDGWTTDECQKAANAIREEYEAQGLAS